MESNNISQRLKLDSAITDRLEGGKGGLDSKANVENHKRWR